MDMAELLGIGYRQVGELRATDPWIDCWAAFEGGGADNMRAWLAAGRPAADPSALCYQGPEEIGEAFRDALRRMPAAPAWFVINNAIVVGGRFRGELGSCGGRMRVPCENPFPIKLHVADPRIAAHEAAHSWGWTSDPLGLKLTHPVAIAEHRADLAEMLAQYSVEAVETGRIDEMARIELLPERKADVLASVWLGETIDTVSCRIEAAREAIRQRAKAATARAAATES